MTISLDYIEMELSDPNLRIYEVHWLKLAFQVTVASCVRKSTSKIIASES